MKRSALAWKPAEPAAQNARRVLPLLVRDYFTSGRKLRRESSVKAMHGFRLKTKRLRYTLETFASLYGPGIKLKVARLRPIQNALGDAHDCEVLLGDRAARLSQEFRAFLQKRSKEKRKDFLRYWREEFDAPEEERKWEQYLTRRIRPKPTSS